MSNTKLRARRSLRSSGVCRDSEKTLAHLRDGGDFTFGQGYYHTCFAFDLDFKPTGFLGNNPALISFVQSSVRSRRVDDHLHASAAGHGNDELACGIPPTAWFACDVSVYGVPFATVRPRIPLRLQLDEGPEGDFLSGILFIMFGNMLLFLFANNTYLSSVSIR